MEKKRSESFKEYAVRWRNLAAQITLEPTNKELMKSFVKTLPSEFRNRMASTYVESFNQLILVGEHIEMGIRMHKIQNLLDTKAFSFQTARPNVQKNPLPEHEGTVNTILEPEVRRIKNLKVHVADAYNGLVRAGYYPDQEDVPLSLMKERVARIVDDGIIVYADHNYIVSTISHIIIDWEEEQAVLDDGKRGEDPSLTDMPPLEDASDEEIVIEMPQPYEYVNNKAVHWSYDLDVDLVTRSGRTYAQNNAQLAKPVTNEEAKKFLTVIKASEYNIVDQLRKMPAQISLLKLFQTSSVHQKSLMKVLSEICVPETVEADKLENFMRSVILKDMIAFSDEEFPLEGRGHNKALYISVKHKVSHVSRVLIDNGFALNICPLATLHRLKVDSSKIHAAKTSVRAFDGTKKEVIGEIHLDVQIGPVVFNIPFQVLDIPTAFNFLLGRPWIHTAGAVFSSLHQTIKFMIERKLVTVYGEEDH
ncbi:uncharacterized protein LOC104446303 [Eucalyptus grandis]|uniref:uncharacterized protein LOC104446303 n=1 Tax=Eucalyptus grandis TaxID=71139 RepID=UPI00192E90A7|nr:uncharacterized protein LOC104446303 [Eucalyptus grandis]